MMNGKEMLKASNFIGSKIDKVLDVENFYDENEDILLSMDELTRDKILDQLSIDEVREEFIDRLIIELRGAYGVNPELLGLTVVFIVDNIGLLSIAYVGKLEHYSGHPNNWYPYELYADV